MVENVADLPMLDSTGKEKRIYNALGAKIVRRTAIALPNGAITYAGLLIDLQDIDSLFMGASAATQSNSDDSDADADEAAELALYEGPRTRLSVFPQAYLATWGHFQADSIMRTFDAPIKAINDEFRFNETDRRGNSTLIQADSCQGYNELSHRTAPRAGSHDVQQGLLTASLMRGEGLSATELTKTQKWRDACIGSLPHNRVRDKILLDDCPRSFRMEHVYNIDNWAIPVATRNGR